MSEGGSVLGTSMALPETVPLFPLPNHVFLPGSPRPYRIFEPRYKAMIEYLLASPEDVRWLGIPRLDTRIDGDYSGAPPFAPVAAIGRLVHCSTLENGDSLIIVAGESRCRLSELPSEHSFRLAQVEPWPDLDTAKDAPEIRARVETVRNLLLALAQMLGRGGKELGELIRDSSEALPWSERLGAVLIGNPDSAQRFLESRSLLERIGMLEEAVSVAIALAGEDAAGRPDFPRS